MAQTLVVFCVQQIGGKSESKCVRVFAFHAVVVRA